MTVRQESQPAYVPSDNGRDAALVNHLEQELEVTRADLQSSIEKFETSTEHLRISNEEVVSTNEELRSLNEELESSKEELQSLNEELTTVNQQLEVKVRELETSNSDLQNVLVSSDIATICLDESLRIKWFAPATQRQFHFIPADAGRPIADMVAAIGDTGMVVAARSILAMQNVADHEFQTESGRWYIRRILPYVEADKRNNGLILTYTDITDTHLANTVARMSQQHLLASGGCESQMKLLSIAMVNVEERERRALAQDLHDDLGQLMAIVALKVSAVEKQALSPTVRQLVLECGKSVDQVHRKLRTMALQLSPPMLESMDLVSAMKWLADEMYGLYKIDIAVEDDGKPKPMEPALRITLFRAVRELLINVAKHARVEHAGISLRCDSKMRLSVSVRDAGAGFNPDSVVTSVTGGGFGLLSMRERIGFIGGEMIVRSIPGDGTEVTLKVPLLAPSKASHVVAGPDATKLK